MGKKIISILSFIILGSIECYSFSFRDYYEPQNDSIVWIRSNQYVLNLLRIKDHEDSLSRHRSIIDRVKKRNIGWLELNEFIANHIMLESEKEQCVFDSVDDIESCLFLGPGGCHVVYDDGIWAIVLTNATFGVSYATVYIFQHNNGRLYLFGSFNGEPIQSHGWEYIYSIKESLFSISTKDSLIYSRNLTLE
jgi:hypothetical protein